MLREFLSPILVVSSFALGFALAPAKAAGAEPVLVGQSAGITGGQAEYSKDVKQGIEACFEAVNKQGGLYGRPLKLVTEDDKGKKDNVLANTKKLVETDKVVALIGYTSGAGVETTLPYLDSHDVPMLSPATGNMGIRAAFHRNLFHTRAGYDDEMKRLIGNLAITGLKRFAIAYLEDVGPANPSAMHAALKANKLEAVAAVGLNRNAASFEPQIETLLKAKPEAVVFISNGPPIVKIVQAMRARGYQGKFASSSFSGTGMVDDLGKDGAGLVLSQVLPAPHKTHLKMVREYQQDLRDLDPKAQPNFTSLEGYVAARVLVEGLRRAGAKLTSERLVAALEEMRRVDLGGYEISFSARSHDGSRFVDTAVIGADGALKF